MVNWNNVRWDDEGSEIDSEINRMMEGSAIEIVIVDDEWNKWIYQEYCRWRSWDRDEKGGDVPDQLMMNDVISGFVTGK